MSRLKKGLTIIQDTTLIDKSKIGVEAFYNIELTNRSRKSEFIKIKHAFIYVLYKYYKYKNIVLSRYWKYDHTTICHLINKIETYCSIYPEYQELITDLNKIIKRYL